VAGTDPPITSPAVPDQEEVDPVARARAMTEFFGPRVPGQLGCVFDHAGRDLVLGHIDVTANLIAGTGYLFAPAVVALADTCAAIGCGVTTPEGASFTTIELKTNFLSSAREGERVTCRCTPAHLGRQTQVWDAVVTNEATGRTMALFRCTQMVLHAR
jgi:1,4-dihydroxy-2-naphthoyl-CoA hydrolase